MPACGWEAIGCDNCSAFASLDDAMKAAVQEWAVDYLWQWTNQRFGLCSEIVRPCRQTCIGSGPWAFPWDQSFPFFSLGCGRCGDSCSCQYVEQVKLPGIVSEPLEVLIDDEAVDLSAFRVDDWTILVRQDGGRFPTCQNLGLPLGEDGTWGIEYLQGEPVPPGGELMAGLLAQEFAKSVCGDDSCRLPRRVSSIQRQGVVIGILDNFTGLKEGLTGIFEIDAWIMSQTKPRRRAVVRSPDVPVPRITTWSYADS